MTLFTLLLTWLYWYKQRVEWVETIQWVEKVQK